MPGIEGELQLVLGLVVAVHEDALRVDACLERQIQLAAGRDVDREPLLRHQPVGGRDRERLRRVDDLEVVRARRERLDVGAGAGPHVVLGVDVGGGAESIRQLDDVAAADLEMAALVHPRAERDRRG